MNQLLKLVTLALVIAPLTGAFPTYRSLGGLSKEQLDLILPTLDVAPPEVPPGPLSDTSTKLVDDAAHPFIQPGPDDLRGPCPGLNTLANHGWIPRNGIATPGQIMNAVQDAYNMENGLGKFITYSAFVVDGNPITNLISIGGKTSSTGRDPPEPALVGGLNAHAVFEGDASLTRQDAYFGDNHSFNETLWSQLVDYSNRFGAGKYNLTVAGELRHQRIQQSIATNPEFSFRGLRYFVAYAETVFPSHFFVDGRQGDDQLDMDAGASFFRENRFPRGFHRANGAQGHDGLTEVAAAHPIRPGTNMGQVNTYTEDLTSADLTTFCKLYGDFLNITVKGLYPAPTGILKDALNRNLDYLYEYVNNPKCPQVFPWGR